MSIFGTIMNKIFHHGAAASPASAPAPAPAAADPNAGAMAAASVAQSATDAVLAAAATPAPAPTASTAPVDVAAVLTQMAGEKGETLDWQHSIVDLLKLLDMDSSLAARKELAGELNVHVGADGSAEENVALHKAVMDQLAANSGHVPDSLRGK